MRQDYKHFTNLDEYLSYLIKRGIAKNKTEALKKARIRIPKENYFAGRILKYLRSKPLGLKLFAWKNHGDIYQESGMPDISVVVNGRFIGLEVKRPLLGELSALQKETMQQIKDAGGQAYIVSYEEEVEMILKKLIKEER